MLEWPMIYNPGDRKPIATRIEMVNSMDRTLPFRLTIGYFRFVCANGLVWGGIGEGSTSSKFTRMIESTRSIYQKQ